MRTTKKLYQWDTDQKLIDCVGKYVDYPIGGGVYRIDVIDKECIIPDELLQVSGTVKVYECMEYGTVKAYAFYINPRPKPPDYVFTPTERLTFEGLVKKVDETIADLQKRADSGEFNGSDYVITESDYDAISAKTADKLQPTIGELARTLETEKTDREQADKDIQKEMPGKLSEPAEGLDVGKYFRVAQIDENGHAVLEAVDAKTIGVQDVKVNGESIVAGENGIADLPIASGNQLGLVRVQPVGTERGVYISSEGFLATQFAIASQINKRTNFNNSITPYNLDYAVKAAMCDGKGAAWTADEQAAARERIGIPGDYELIEEITLTDETSEIIRDTDTLGNQYSMKNLLLYVSAGITTLKMSIRIEINGIYIIDTENIGDGKYSYGYVCRFGINNGLLYTFLIGNRGSITNRYAVNSSIKGMTINIDIINSFRLRISNPIEGTIIKIYGVRA